MVSEPPPIDSTPIDEEPPDPDRHPIRVVVTGDLHRWRLTVGFRWILVIPLLIWLFIWSIGAFFAGIVNWFLTLIKGRSPLSLHDFFASYVRFTTHVHAYLFLAADPYPNFTGKPGYPVDVEIDPPAPQSRWKTFFRIFLAIPAIAIASTLVGAPGGGGGNSGYQDQSWSGSDYAYSGTFASGFFLLSILAWFACLARGRMQALNRIHDVEERRSTLRRICVATGLGIAVVACLIAAVLVQAVAPSLTDGALDTVLSIVRWPIAILFLWAAVTLLFRYAPAEKPEMRWASGGSLLVIASWLIASGLFREWVTQVADFKSATGSLTVFLLLTSYVMVSASIFLIGAEVDEQARKKSRRS